MSIHSKFWAAREAEFRSTYRGFGATLRAQRDTNRQRCYKAEWKELRPHQTSFTYEAARGYARLCVKIAIRQMRLMGLIKNDVIEEAVRASFKAAFTKEEIKHCNASASGAYFARWGWTDVIIAHEVAHWADQWAHRLRGNPGFGVYYEPHGPKWRGWFAFLLGSAGIKSLPDLLDPMGMVTRAFTSNNLQVTMPGA